MRAKNLERDEEDIVEEVVVDVRVQGRKQEGKERRCCARGRSLVAQGLMNKGRLLVESDL